MDFNYRLRHCAQVSGLTSGTIYIICLHTSTLLGLISQPPGPVRSGRAGATVDSVELTILPAPRTNVQRISLL